MSAHIISVFRNGKKVEKYRVFSLTQGGMNKAIRDVTPEDLIALLKAKPNAELANARVMNDSIEFTQGSMLAYPVIDKSGVLLSQAGLTIIYSVVDENDKVLGYGVADAFGELVNITKKKLITLSSRFKATNWEVYTMPSGEPNIRAKSGTFSKVIKRNQVVVSAINSALESKDVIAKKLKQNEINRAKIKEENNRDKVAEDLGSQLAEEELALNNKILNKSKDGSNLTSSEIISLSSDKILPCLKVYNFADVLDSGMNVDAQKKLVLIKANFINMCPYYASMFDAIKKVPTFAVPTMGVTEDTFYYNPVFLNTLSIPEATFILIHEMLHIAMQHSVRHGNRNNVLWNVACDLYINESICKDFGITYGGTQAEFARKSELDGKTYRGSITAPSSGIFLSSIGESLDFAKDTAESIYARLYKENKDNLNQMMQNIKNQIAQQGQGQGQQNQSQQGQGQGQQSQQGQGQQSQQGQGQQGQQGQGQQGQQGQGQQGQGQSQQGQGQQGQQGQGQGQQNQSQQGQGQSQQGQGQGNSDNAFEGLGTDASGTVGEGGLSSEIKSSDNGEYSQKEVEVEVVYNGKKLKGKVSFDVFSNRSEVSKDNPSQSLNETKTALTRIRTKRNMDEQAGKSVSLTSGTELVERSMEFALTVNYNWEQLLKNLVNGRPKKMYTLGQPNRDYMNRGMTVAQRRQIGKPSEITHIKFAVDVSGSIGEKELHKVFTKIKQILDIYDVKAEMIYWDTQVTNAGDFETLRDLLKIKPMGCGGTDIRCLFDYLMGRTKVNGKKEQSKINEISAVIIFTDGCVFNNYGEYARAFGSRTIWVIDDACPPYKALFGKVAKTKLK